MCTMMGSEGLADPRAVRRVSSRERGPEARRCSETKTQGTTHPAGDGADCVADIHPVRLQGKLPALQRLQVENILHEGRDGAYAGVQNIHQLHLRWVA